VQPNHCGILSPGMSTTVTIRLLEKYKRTLVHPRNTAGGGGGGTAVVDGIAVTSMEDKFFVHSCVVEDSIVNGDGSLPGIGGDGGIPLTSSFSTAGASTTAQSQNQLSQRSIGLSTSASTIDKKQRAKPVSDERMGGIWKMANKNPSCAIYKRKLLVQHIYPGKVNVLETTPAEELEFTLPYNPGMVDGNSSRRSLAGGGSVTSNGLLESNRSLLSHSTPATTTVDDDVHLQSTRQQQQRLQQQYPGTIVAEGDDSSQSANIPRCFLTLLHTGETDEHILFKVKTNQPRRYRVHPDHQGILSPGDSKMVSIRLLDKYKQSLIKGLEAKRRLGQSTTKLLTTADMKTSNCREQVLKCDDRFFVQYCTVDEAFLREWPNLNDDGMATGGDGGEREERIAGAMSGLWSAAERSEIIKVEQKKFLVKHVIAYDEEYYDGEDGDGIGGVGGNNDLEEEESGASTEVAHPEELSLTPSSMLGDGIDL